ncbi:MAG: hypothetical protein HAW67_06070 [Endozoicomonadaceae bacterium]|nr:hypothetical protein [Endozoicomonadaceae bacterium]
MSTQALASYQYGKVSELSMTPTHMRVQISSANPVFDERSAGCTIKASTYLTIEVK